MVASKGKAAPRAAQSVERIDHPAHRLDFQAARIAGAMEILELLDGNEAANVLGLVRDTLEEVTEEIRDVAVQLRGVPRG